MDLWRSAAGKYPAPDFPEFPSRVLLIHCIAKGAQWSVLGLPLAPLLALTRGRSLGAVYRPLFIGLPVVGITATLGMLGYKAAAGMDEDGVDDRAYRISKSAGQVAVDGSSGRAALVGAAAGAIFGRHGVSSVLAAASLGCALAVAAHGAQLGVAEARASGFLPPADTRQHA
jgi:hypothetical protein